jgi:hypothetical protein
MNRQTRKAHLSTETLSDEQAVASTVSAWRCDLMDYNCAASLNLDDVAGQGIELRNCPP